MTLPSSSIKLSPSKVKDMVSKYTDNILYDVKKIVGVVFGMRREAMRLRPRSWKEPHLLLYQALDGKPHHTGIEMVSSLVLHLLFAFTISKILAIITLALRWMRCYMASHAHSSRRIRGWWNLLPLSP